MAKKKNTLASKLGYEDVEITTIDGRKCLMGDYFRPDDFAIDTGSEGRGRGVIKHDGMQRVLFNLFVITKRTVEVYDTPKKVNEWCAVVKVCMTVVPRIEEGPEIPFHWEAVADCRTGNAMSGMSRYTTAIAETRASGRVIRRLLGLEEFCTKEELAETTLDVEDDTKPVQAAQILLIKKFLNDPAKKYTGCTIEAVNKRLKRKEGDANFILESDIEDKEVLQGKLTVGQAAELIQKLHTYDVLKPEE